MVDKYEPKLLLFQNSTPMEAIPKVEEDILTYTIEKTRYGDDYNNDDTIVPLIISELFNSMQPHFPTYVTNLAEKPTRHFMATVWEELIAPYYPPLDYRVKHGRLAKLLYIWPLMEYLGKEGYSELNALKFWSTREDIDLNLYGDVYWGRYNRSQHPYNRMKNQYPQEEARWTYRFCAPGPVPDSYTSLVRELLDCKDKNPLLKNGRWCQKTQSIVYDKPLPYVEEDPELLQALSKLKMEYQVKLEEAARECEFLHKMHCKSLRTIQELHTARTHGMVKLEEDMDAKKPERVEKKRKAEEELKAWTEVMMEDESMGQEGTD
jgi:hypothetical protein